MTEWKDATVYAKNEIRGVKPINAWSVNSGNLQISVLSAHRMHPGAWVCTCHQLSINSWPLRLRASAPAEEAQARAHALVGDTITELHNSFLKISEE